MAVSKNLESDPVLVAYFGKYLPAAEPVQLDDFQESRGFRGFRKFDEALASQPRRLGGDARRRVLGDTVRCLEYVLISVFGGVRAESTLGPGVQIGDGIVSHEAWVVKCLANPVADSIRAKCLALLVKGERPVEPGTLFEMEPVQQLCEAIGCPGYGELLHERVVRTANMLAAEDWRTARYADVWSEGPDAEVGELLASAFALLKIEDFGRQGLLNPRREVASPVGVLDPLLGSIDKGWPFQHLVAGLAFLYDTVMGPNGGVLETIWGLWKQAAQPAAEDQLAEALTRILGLIERRPWHHDIKDFKRVMKLVPPGREELLTSFEPTVMQGCNPPLLHLVRGFPGVPLGAKAEVVQLMDTARGRAPSGAWTRKKDRLQASAHWDVVVGLARWVAANSELRKPNGPLDWSDQVFTRFQKASDWILADPVPR